MRQLLRSASIAAVVCLAAVGCERSPNPERASATPAAQPAAVAETITDEHSYAEPEKVGTATWRWTWRSISPRKSLGGTATYTWTGRTRPQRQLVLDTRDLTHRQGRRR